MHEVRDPADCFSRIREQRLADLAVSEVTDKGNGKLVPGRGFDRGRDPLLADIGE